MADAGRCHRLTERARAQLEADFLATTYRIETSAGPIDLRIGESSDALDSLLLQEAARDWAFISAANPGARPMPDEINARRHNALRAALDADSYPLLPGQGLPASPRWKPEPSWFVMGVPLQRAVALARNFGQLAIVAGERGSAPKLIWC